VAANNTKRGTTVLTTYDITAGEYIVTKDELEFQIATERKFIEKQRAAQQRMRNLETGVRSGNISADLAAFDMSVWKSEERIAEHEKKIKELENEN
jgi:hypothetical protein